MISQSSLPVIFQLLKDDTPADVFFAALTGQEVAGASADQGREMDLALALYSELLHHIENQTFFGIQAWNRSCQRRAANLGRPQATRTTRDTRALRTKM